MNNELTAALLTIEKCRELTNCPAGVDLQDWVKQLAAENVALKSKGRELLGEACAVYSRLNKLIDPSLGDFVDGQTLHEFQFVLDVETPATDRIVAGIKADAANQMCVAFVKHKELAGLSDDDVVTVREATDAVLHCAEVISEGADK